MEWHLATLNIICQPASHCSKLVRSSCRVKQPWIEYMFLYRTQSSANRRTEDLMLSGKSLKAWREPFECMVIGSCCEQHAIISSRCLCAQRTAINFGFSHRAQCKVGSQFSALSNAVIILKLCMPLGWIEAKNDMYTCNNNVSIWVSPQARKFERLYLASKVYWLRDLVKHSFDRDNMFASL